MKTSQDYIALEDKYGAHNYHPLQPRWLVKLWANGVARGENTAQQAAWSRSADNALDPKSDFAENLISGYHLKKGKTHYSC